MGFNSAFTGLILSSHLRLGLPSGLSLFPHQNPVHASPLPHTRYMPRPSNSSWFYHLHNIGWGVEHCIWHISSYWLLYVRRDTTAWYVSKVLTSPSTIGANIGHHFSSYSRQCQQHSTIKTLHIHYQHSFPTQRLNIVLWTPSCTGVSQAQQHTTATAQHRCSNVIKQP